ncbi:MAG TPA: hypothetical protein VK155_10350 [Bacteroidales bacterium]|jgi:hypothetical protein|nr:hypothetical protein [Bacteroidales bacterium]
MEFKLQDYLKEIDAFVRDWHNAAKKNMEFANWVEYFKKHPFSFTGILPYRYFPEPIIGDPDKSVFKAVFINLNPGAGDESKDVFNESASVLEAYRNNGYKYFDTIRAMIKQNQTFFNEKCHSVPLKYIKSEIDNLGKSHELPPFSYTYAWWYRNKLSWLIKNNLCEKVELDEIIGLELTPWHSETFSEMKNTVTPESIFKYVILPAFEFSKKIKNDHFRQGNKSIVIAKGSPLKELLVEDKVKELIEENNYKSSSKCEPVEADNRWSKWFIEDGPGHKCIFLIYSVKGFNMALPSKIDKDFFKNELEKKNSIM